jgi:hypothetical protein
MRPVRSQTPHPRRAAAAILAAIAAASGLVGTATAGASVVFPTPGVMQVDQLPASVRAGHTFTLREVMPLAVWFGRARFQRQTAAGGWRTLATAAIRPRVFWLHWWVPARLAGSQITVRFVVVSRAQILAVSPAYTLNVTGTRREAGRR